MPYLADIAQQNANQNGAAGLAATNLGGAVDDYLKLVARKFLHREFTKRMRFCAHLLTLRCEKL
jgi:hypothetical protein